MPMPLKPLETPEEQKAYSELMDEWDKEIDPSPQAQEAAEASLPSNWDE